MGSHLDSIGFSAEDPAAFVELAERAVTVGEALSTESGTYHRWRAGGGAELWAQVDRDGGLMGLHPHFDGDARMPVALTELITPPEGTVLDGTLHAWADPQDEDPESGMYPFAFDVPDMARTPGLRLPALATAQLAAFAYEVDAFADEAALDAAQEGDVGYAAESLIPTGLFDEPLLPQVFLHGTVLESDVRTNEATGVDFAWMRVRTLGGEMDVVTGAGTLEGAPASGAVVRVEAHLSGRVHDVRPLPGAEVAERPRPRRRGLLRRWVGRGSH